MISGTLDKNSMAVGVWSVNQCVASFENGLLLAANIRKNANTRLEWQIYCMMIRII